MERVSPGEIVRIKSNVENGDRVCLLISVSQGYWDLGEGDCSFGEIAEIVMENRTHQVPLSWLVPL